MSEAAHRSPQQLAAIVARVERLHTLTARLSAALHVAEIASLVVQESASVLGAHSCGLWRHDPGADHLILEGTHNYPEAALALVRSLPLEPGIPVADAVITKTPIWLSSREEYEARYPRSGARTASMAPAMYAVAALPIQLGERVFGVLALTFVDDRVFDEDERRFLTMLAFHCAQGFERARLLAAAEVATERALFLSRASAVLGSSLDYEETLRNVAALAVPGIGDWCGVELVDDDGAHKQVAVAHVDPAKVQMARDLRAEYPPDPNARSGVPQILRTGVSELYPEISDEMLAAGARNEAHLATLRTLGLRSAMAVPIKDRGNVVGVITFVISDSARRYTVDDLRMAEQLAERAGAAIGNAQLYAAANAAISVREDFLSIAGHELRTPISALTLHLQMQTQAPDGTPIAKLRERGQKMLEQTTRLTRLVEELLDVAKLNAGRLTLDREDFDLAGLVREVAERVAEPDRPLELELASVTGWWDRGRLDQVVMNLLTNATKYGKGSPVRARLEDAGDAVVLTVSDLGIGIAPEDQERIFQRFERAVSARNFGGMGLGLWIVRQLVEMHGGSIRVESQLGAGATFTVTLPKHAPGADARSPGP